MEQTEVRGDRFRVDEKMRFLKRGTEWAFSNRISLDRFQTPVKWLEHDAIMRNIQAGFFGEPEFFILKCLYQLGVCTIESLTEFTLSKVRCARPGTVPLSPDKVTYAYVKKRLDAFQAGGLAGHYRYRVSGQLLSQNDNLYQSGWFVTKEGYNAVKAHYLLPAYYEFNDALAYLPIVEIIKRIATKKCCTSLVRCTDQVEIYGEYTARIKDEGSGKKGERWIKHELICYGNATRADGSRLKIVFEPMYYQCDPMIRSEEDNLHENSYRMDMLRRLVETDKLDGIETVIVIVVEDLDGLKSFIHMIKGEPDLSFYKEKCFFTSAALSCILMKGDLDNALLRMVVEDGAVKFVNGSIFNPAPNVAEEDAGKKPVKRTVTRKKTTKADGE